MAARAAQPAAVDADMDGFGTRDLGDDAFGDGALLELDEPVPRRAPPGPAARAPAARDNAAVGSTVPKDANPNLLVTLQELAGFGPPPGGLVSSGRYAIHVGLRLLALRKERKRVLSTVTEAEAEHRSALERLGEELSTRAQGVQPLKSQLDAVSATLQQLSRADEQLSQARDESRVALAELARSRAALEQEIAPFVEAERVALGALRKAEEDLKRAQAWLKRVEIELRALQEAEVEADPNKVAALEQQRSQREDSVAAAEAALAPLQEKHGLAKRELSAQRARLDAVDQQRRGLEAGAAERETSIGKQTQAAGDEHRTALRNLAEAARERGLTGGGEREARVDASARHLEQTRTALDHVERARDLYDHAGVRNGVLLLVALLGLAVAVVLFGPALDPS